MGQEVGSVTEDRGAGIAGVSGVIAHGIPLRFHLRIAIWAVIKLVLLR